MTEEFQQTAEIDSSEPLEPIPGDSATEETQEPVEAEASEPLEIASAEPVDPEPDSVEAPPDERHQPDVIDLKALFKPIPGENPSGENLRYSGLYDEIAEARRADDNLNQGAWQTELKTADYSLVIDLTVPELINISKDLKFESRLSECIVKQLGFVDF